MRSRELRRISGVGDGVVANGGGTISKSIVGAVGDGSGVETEVVFGTSVDDGCDDKDGCDGEGTSTGND